MDGGTKYFSFVFLSGTFRGFFIFRSIDEERASGRSYDTGKTKEGGNAYGIRLHPVATCHQKTDYVNIYFDIIAISAQIWPVFINLHFEGLSKFLSRPLPGRSIEAKRS
jgi:hypothetical protein